MWVVRSVGMSEQMAAPTATTATPFTNNFHGDLLLDFHGNQYSHHCRHSHRHYHHRRRFDSFSVFTGIQLLMQDIEN